MLAMVHNWHALLNRLLGLRSPITDIEHLQLFSPRSINALLAKGGFESVSQCTIRNTYPLSYWLRLTPLPEGIKQTITTVLARVRAANKSLSMHVGNLLVVGYTPPKNAL